jgi:hypothetical protein
MTRDLRRYKADRLQVEAIHHDGQEGETENGAFAKAAHLDSFVVQNP